MDRDLLSTALDNAHEAFLSVDAGGIIVAWSAGAERLYGYSAGEACGRPIEVLWFPGERPDLAAGGPRALIRRQRHRSGRELWVALRVAALGEAGRRPGLLLCALEVGDLRRAEGDLAGSRVALEASRTELRRVAERLVAGEERARRQIAGELHDDLGPRIVAAALAVEAAKRLLPAGAPAPAPLTAAADGLTRLADDVRRLSHHLHPSALDRRGLADALRDHCAEVEKNHRLPVRFSVCAVTESLPPEAALSLYRIAQEALANAVRHARARSVHASLTGDEGAVRLAITDDGTGFDPDEARRTGGLGLTSIEERARLIGGRWRIDSTPGAGTEIEVSVPLSVLESDAEPAAAEPATESGPQPSHVGPYRLLEEIGAGSTATVYLAEEPEPLGRRLAIKLHRNPLPGRRETLRFRAEQQALARLHHPAIAEVFEARTTEQGDPYLVMEYVPGLPITEHCDRYGLDLDRRLRLFAAVCAGVRHAHRKGVLHRDLKPANVLVTEEGGAARPKIVDFGVAKGLDRPLAEGTVWTVAELAGTPAYLAPETLSGGEADTRSDVYSLGVVLYELLTGALPVEAGEGGIAALIEAVRRGDVRPPSRRLAAIEPVAAEEAARCRGLRDPAQLARRLAGDLDRVALKALAADPADRYPTVDDLGAEIERVLRGEPVEAGPTGPLPQLRRLVRRHRRLAAAVALVILTLGAGLTAAAVQARRAEREAARADAVALFLEELFESSDPRRARGDPPDARELLRRGTERLAGDLEEQPLVRARLLETLGGIHTELGFYGEALPLLEEALALRERLRGGSHPEVAATLVRLGALAHVSGRDDPEPLFRRALAIREKSLGREHPEVAHALNQLGAALAARGRFDEAEAALRRALAIHERLWGEGDPRVARTLHNLGGIALHRGRIDESERLLERALAIREAALPDDDLELAGSREGLALVRRRQGRPAEAAALLERLAATAERVWGPEHPYLAKTLLNLGLARRDLGQDAVARGLFERAVAICDHALADDHPQLVRALAALADHHLALGREAEAAPLYRQLLALHASGVPYEDWDGVLARAGRLAAAGERDPTAR